MAYFSLNKLGSIRGHKDVLSIFNNKKVHPCDTRTEKFKEKEKVAYSSQEGERMRERGRKIYMRREEEIPTGGEEQRL